MSTLAEDGSTGEQVGRVVELVRATLGADLLGMYLYGSAVDGGLRPASDLDLFVVTSRRATAEQRWQLIDGLRPLSARDARPPAWRPVELTVVAQPDVVPWRYPPRMDFISGEWLRGRFDAGDMEPGHSVNPDLAVLISQVRLTGRPLVGPPAAELLDQVPRADLRRGMTDSIGSLLDDLDTDTANVLLTLARIWYTLAVGAFAAKDAAADWALERLSAEHRAPLQRARAIYLGHDEDSWQQQLETARVGANKLVEQIKRLTSVATIGER